MENKRIGRILKAHSVEAGLPSINKLCKGKPVVPYTIMGIRQVVKAQDFDSCITLVRIQHAQLNLARQNRLDNYFVEL